MMMHCFMVNTMQSVCMCNSFKQNFVYTRSTKHVHYWAHTGRLIFECGMGDVMDVSGKYQVELAMVVTQFTLHAVLSLQPVGNAQKPKRKGMPYKQYYPLPCITCSHCPCILHEGLELLLPKPGFGLLCCAVWSISFKCLFVCSRR